MTLDARTWRSDFTRLRAPVLATFPRLHRQDVEATGDDFDALIELIQRQSGLSAGEVHERLADIDEAGATADGDGADTGDDASADGARASIDQLRIDRGFEESEHERVRDIFRKLDRQLNRFPADGADMELTVKDRDTTAQKVTFEVWLPKMPRVVATSKEHSLRDALMDVREDAWRQINEQLDRRQR